MTRVRVGAVGYLNARPLVRGLARENGRFDVRFDVPSTCASLLHDGAIDVGLIPSIEYFGGPDYRVVPGIGIISNGPVASVALFTTREPRAIRSVALDSSSRTSAALVRILCAEHFAITPEFRTLPPDPAVMLRQCDAALLIGDVALFLDAEEAGVEKIDLGDEWTRFTGLPFVWAFWAGRRDALTPEDIAELTRARDEGIAHSDEEARAYLADRPDRIPLGVRYLRESIKFVLGEHEKAGLQRYYDAAARLGIIPPGSTPSFYGE